VEPLQQCALRSPEWLIEGSRDNDEEIAWVEVTVGEQISLQDIERERNKKRDPDPLADGDAKVVDGQLSKRRLPHAVNCLNETRVVGWFRPNAALKFLKRLGQPLGP